MKSLLLWSLVVLLSPGIKAQSAARKTADPNPQAHNPLIGAWKLVSLEDFGANAQVRQIDCAGMFVFTADGKAAVQLMYRNAQSGSAYAKGGYEASFGSYRLETSSTFTFHIEGALVRRLIGKDLSRAYEISGNRLTVKSTDANEHWRVIWERY